MPRSDSRPLRIPWSRRPKPVVGGKRGRTGRSEIDPKLRDLIFARAGGRCECCDEPLPHPFHAHHRKLRSRGGQDSACNLNALCPKCHNRVHGHVAWSTGQGFIVSAFEDPARVPVAIHCEEWRYLSSDGKYVPTERAS